jgi:hypothetical protein
MPDTPFTSRHAASVAFVLRRVRIVALLCVAGLLLPPLAALLPQNAGGSLVWLLDLACHWQWLFFAGLVVSSLACALAMPRWARTAGGSRLPTVVAGDLNATPWSPAFNELDDLGLRRATGLAPTWPSALHGISGIPVDHVPASRHWRLVASGREPDLGSDHRPVIARLVPFGEG